jgi:hypothetical protein
MWIPAGLVYVIAGLALFAGWLRESGKRPQTDGIEFNPLRVSQALSAALSRRRVPWGKMPKAIFFPTVDFGRVRLFISGAAVWMPVRTRNRRGGREERSNPHLLVSAKLEAPSPLMRKIREQRE